MQSLNNNIKAFFELVKAGLWEKDVQLLPFAPIDFKEIYRLAQEQAVVGLVAAGLEYVQDVKIPQDMALTFAGSALQIEQRNRAMNYCIGIIVDKMRQADIYTILVKGQGVAQCYERPLWRMAGDIDLYLSYSNYEKAKSFLIPLAKSVETEDKGRLHLGVTIDPWVVELHGTLHTSISKKMNIVSDEVHQDIFFNGNIRSWNNDNVQVFLPSPDNDVIIVFNHFISHFYGEGIGLRQLCDWCRLLWTYKDDINFPLLERRINKMGLMTEWRAFASFAVENLGMPVISMPFYVNSAYYKNKAERIRKLVIETGNFGHNKDYSYRGKYSFAVGNFITFFRRLKEFMRIIVIFPLNTPRFFVRYVYNRMRTIL